MSKTQPIILLKDDKEIIEPLEQALARLQLEQALARLQVKNQPHFLEDGRQFLNSMNTTEKLPLLIISNVNARGIDGIKRKNTRRRVPAQKGTPFVHLSNDAHKVVGKKNLSCRYSTFSKSGIP